MTQSTPESAEHGYLTYLVEVEGGLDSPDREAVIAAARRVREIGYRHGEPNLVTLSLLGEGRARLRQARAVDGMALLDEAMVTVVAGELLPEWAGNIYCHRMAVCHELADPRRALPGHRFHRVLVEFDLLRGGISQSRCSDLR
ncbi:MAG: hypothetical protein ACRDUV_17885 [Pseudonocardiaceae bacterium]